MHSALIDLSGKHSEIWIHFPWMLRLPGDSLLTSTLLLKADRRWDLQAFAAILTENHVGSDGFHLQHLPLSLHPPHEDGPAAGDRKKIFRLWFGICWSGRTWCFTGDILTPGCTGAWCVCSCVSVHVSVPHSLMRINHGQISRWTGTSSLIYPITRWMNQGSDFLSSVFSVSLQIGQ